MRIPVTVQCGLGARQPERHRTRRTRSNMPMQPTASRARSLFFDSYCGALAAADGQAVGRLGSVVDIPFLLVTSQSRFGNARCARRVVPVPVVLVWFDGPWCGVPVVPSVIVCCTWFQPNARRADVVPC